MNNKLSADIVLLHQKLCIAIRHHAAAYYAGQPEVSDGVFDRMIDDIRRWERAYPELRAYDSPSDRVGWGVGNQPVQTRMRRMLSLQSVKTKKEILDWCCAQKGELIFEPKIDGCAICATYNNGRFESLTFRGDGWSGDKIKTSECRTPLPKQIDFDGRTEIHGEAYLTNDDFELVNEYLSDTQHRSYADQRSMANGLLSCKNNQSKKYISFLFFNVVTKNNIIGIKNENDVFAWLSQNAIPTFKEKKRSVCFGGVLKNVYSHIIDEMQNDNEFNYATDGVVVKAFRIFDRQVMGETSNVPRWAMSYKWPVKPEQSTIISMSKFGNMSKIKIKPVRIAGRLIQRIYQKNVEFLRVGQDVNVTLVGGTWPKIESFYEREEK